MKVYVVSVCWDFYESAVYDVEGAFDSATKAVECAEATHTHAVVEEFDLNTSKGWQVWSGDGEKGRYECLRDESGAPIKRRGRT